MEILCGTLRTLNQINSIREPIVFEEKLNHIITGYFYNYIILGSHNSRAILDSRRTILDNTLAHLNGIRISSLIPHDVGDRKALFPPIYVFNALRKQRPRKLSYVFNQD